MILWIFLQLKTSCMSTTCAERLFQNILKLKTDLSIAGLQTLQIFNGQDLTTKIKNSLFPKRISIPNSITGCKQIRQAKSMLRTFTLDTRGQSLDSLRSR